MFTLNKRTTETLEILRMFSLEHVKRIHDPKSIMEGLLDDISAYATQALDICKGDESTSIVTMTKLMQKMDVIIASLKQMVTVQTVLGLSEVVKESTLLEFSMRESRSQIVDLLLIFKR